MLSGTHPTLEVCPDSFYTAYIASCSSFRSTLANVISAAYCIIVNPGGYAQHRKWYEPRSLSGDPKPDSEG